jgi:hypothetical protein
MKKMIRRWLGIYVDFFPDEHAIRRMIAEELVKIMDNEHDGTGWNGGSMYNAFTRTVEFTVNNKVYNIIPDEIRRVTNTEVFLDNIIDRIKRKQI